ncbi:thiol reductant ABC exporter subunit CydD [Halomonas sp. YLGW01]|uniref:thiol reductant ABC exporter subunit CydD n=1 Tax=Halomonas sp. YLGW01 TaxID=2773308 RepID=UPI00178100D5|nr:thiol reductant ABC exporter subunit CydD [Halomonas sp. YLGW01]
MASRDASNQEPRTSKRWLKDLAAGERRRLTLATLAGLGGGLCTIVQMLLLALIIDRLLTGVPEAPVGALFVALIAVLGLRALAQWVQDTTAQAASLAIRARARAALLDQLAALGPVRLASRHSAGLGSQLVEQVEALDGYFARFLPQLRLATALPLVILAIVLSLDWLAAVFLLLAAPLIPLFMALVGMGAQRLNQAQFAAVTRLSGHFLDRVRGITTLQLFGRTASAADEVFGAADDYRARSMKTLRLAFLSSAVLEFFASVAIAVIAIYVGFGLLGYIDYGPSASLTLYSGLTILLLAPEFFQPLRSLSQHYHDRAAALGAAEALVVLLNETPPASAEMRPEGRTHADVPVRLIDACVEHAGRGRVLGPVSLEVRRGEVIALTGPSGAGKSTLLQLIAGFVAPSAGRAEVMSEARPAWMDQRPLVIQGTIADNLRLADTQASDDAMRQALQRAGLAELLSRLPAGLETPIGERGAGLSGGQAQRLALARVFLSDASLVLLDEPTASLDEASEAEVAASLARLTEEGRTLVIATHHPALMVLADRVVRLEAGQRVEEESA